MGWDSSKPPPGKGPNPWWGTPDKDNNNFRAPGNGGMFRDTRLPDQDDPSKSFTTRKRHGWWGKEERYDESGKNRLDGSGSRRRAWFFDEG